ncbi:MAG: peptidoglycan DD-metalloendopeptidase family protein [Verrucomicrobiaceae bacterium]
MPASTPVGVKNKNYLNVKNGSDPWLDAAGKSKTDPKGHAIFTDAAYGVRAGILLLRTYYLTHQLKSVLEILSRWAPVSDTIGSQAGNAHNNPTEYAIFVSNKMGVDYNQKLELFHADKSINNVGQLRGLFFAMAEYEVGGGFKVPEKEFNAGLELLEPGITKTGTTPAPAASTEAAAPPAPATQGWSISGSVGRVDKGAANKRADVETVQSMLRSAAMILGNPSIDPGGLDGKISDNASKSSTVKAIVAFQSRFLTKPDGVIEVDGRTWKELVKVVSGAGVPAAAPATGAEFFPFASLPSVDWTSDPRRFAANRSGNRAHAGCDLYFPKGTVIHAITDGTVVRGPYPFYAETYALEVDHGSFIARYGEIQQSAFVREGDRVVGGQPIALVGHLVGISVPSDMLHLELYDKTAHGPLTTSAANGAVAPNGRPFMRRKDLIDPTPRLNRWKDHLPGAPAPAVPAAEAAAAVASLPAKVPAKGFCVYMKRLREEERPGIGYARTVSNYQCYWNGTAIHDLGGQMAERGGPGDNTSTGVAHHRRIREGVYRLAIQDGARYKTYKYAASGFPYPGLLLEDTGDRTAILIHPCHDSANGYVSSIGCINPAIGLKDADSRVNLTDSRSRVIAIIEGMKAKLGSAFPKTGTIPGAVVVIEGEP